MSDDHEDIAVLLGFADDVHMDCHGITSSNSVPIIEEWSIFDSSYMELLGDTECCRTGTYRRTRDDTVWLDSDETEIVCDDGVRFLSFSTQWLIKILKCIFFIFYDFGMTYENDLFSSSIVEHKGNDIQKTYRSKQ
jgi:hypothetical protein